MMKKCLALLCALSLLLCTLPALAEDLLPVYALAVQGADGTLTYTGAAVLWGDQSTLVTTRWAVAEGTLVAVGNGETLAVTAAAAPFEGSDLRTLALSQPAKAQPATAGAVSEPISCVAATADGLVTQEAAHVTLTAYENEACLLLTGVEGALPGTVLLGSQGEFIGLVVAEYGEGVNRCVAYSPDLLNARLNGEPPVSAAVETDDTVWITGFTVTADKGVMAVDWASCPDVDNAADSAFTLIWADDGNPYISYAEVAWGEDTAFMPALPGRTYTLWLQACSREEMTTPTSRMNAVSCAVPELPPYTDHQFRDASIYLGAAPADEEFAAEAVVPALESITAESLSNPELRYYLQVTSTYQVQEETEANLLIALKAPDGTAYTELSGFIFMPELNENDVWHADITRVISDCMEISEGMPGEYTLGYYLDGQLASEITFTLE